jgi:ribosomal protein L7/L12
MPKAARSSDVIESHSEKALSYGIGGVVLLVLGVLLFLNRGDGSYTPLAALLGGIGAACSAYAIYCVTQLRKVTSVPVDCPYCKKRNHLTEAPVADFSCNGCFRMVPVVEGKILTVQQVRCGYCNELNYYSDKTEVLLCESCNHEIPIAQGHGTLGKSIPKGYAVKEDTDYYELALVAFDHKTEELISALQHMLALNRNQVKEMLEHLPVTLLTGISRKKAEMLQTQLAVHGAAAEFKVLPSRTV